MPVDGLATVLDLGVDWISCSARGGDNALELFTQAYNLVRDEQYWGNEKRPWSSHGYQGEICGHVAYGLRDDEVVVRVGGIAANENFRPLVQSADNVSRIDCQATLKVDGEVEKTIRRHHEQLRKAPNTRGKKPVIRLWQDDGRATGIYVGKWSSDKLGCIYDKGLESGLDCYRGCVRFEARFKRHLASDVATRLVPHVEYQVVAGEVALRYFEQNSAKPAVSSGHLRSSLDHRRDTTRPFVIPSSRRSSSDINRRLAWLNQGVSKTVAKLAGMGLEEHAKNALGLGGPCWQDWHSTLESNLAELR